MRDGIFVTGGSGFVGARLVIALAAAGRPIFVLRRTRSPETAVAPGVTVVTGDLLQPDTYREALRSCDVVLHLAAATGRASASEHWQVNARGTEVLVEACRAAGVSRLLFVSSIAATFPDKTGYHYALAKSRAEQVVAESGLRFAILRPTMILGPGAPIRGALEKLALLPAIVMPGTGRVRVQPIHVDDVVRAIVSVVNHDRFSNATFELGGADVLTMEELLRGFRRARTHGGGSVWHIPLGLMRAPLRAAEAVGLGALLPISAGQLTSFRFDGVAQPNALQQNIAEGLAGAGWMVSESATSAAEAGRDAVAAVQPPPGKECRVFTRYLLRCDPDAYVETQYRAAFATLPVLAVHSRFDAALVGFARMAPLCARIADAYAGVFARDSSLRKRLVLLLAILETRPPFHRAIDQTIAGPAVVVIGRLGVTAVASFFNLVAGTLIFLPTRIALAVAGKRSR